MRKQMSALIAGVILIIGLTGCSTIEDDAKELINVIGEGSGSGELITKEVSTFQVSEFDSIQVNTNVMQIYVTETTGDVAEVKLMADDSITNKFTFDANIQARVLKLDIDEKGQIFNGTFKGQSGERKLEILLPEKQYDLVKINNNFGEVVVTDLKMDQIDIQVDVGSVRLDAVKGAMNLGSNMGQITVEGIRLDHDIKARVDVGEIDIHLDEAPESANIKLESDVGVVNTGLDHIEYSVNSINKKMGTIGTNGHDIDAYTSVGEIQVHIQ